MRPVLELPDARGALPFGAAPPPPPPPQPDLTASALTLTNVTSTGATANFTINNVGTDVAGASTANLYLSADATITTTDTVLGSFATPSLAASGSSSETIAFSSSLSAQVTAGTYYIGAFADSLNVVAESNEGNNASNAVPIILGTTGADTLNGTSANDIMFGFDGGDTLYGAGGSDTMIGGIGADHFLYKARTDGSSGGDRIVDFLSGSDVLDFSRGAFGNHLAMSGGNTGTLAATHFEVNTTGTATKTSAEFIYDSAHNTLYYDSNGSGAGGHYLIAHFDGTVTLSNSDIHIV